MKKYTIFVCAMIASAMLCACGDESNYDKFVEASRNVCRSTVKAYNRCYAGLSALFGMDMDMCEEEYSDEESQLTHADKVALDHCINEALASAQCNAEYIDNIRGDDCSILMSDKLDGNIEIYCSREIKALDRCLDRYIDYSWYDDDNFY